MNPDGFLTKRRLLAVVLVLGSIGVVLVVWLRWPGAQVPAEPPADVTASSKGWPIRYNATVSLLVKGSKTIPFPPLLEMLDENKQLKNFRIKVKHGKDIPDETGARKTILNALKAVTEWQTKQGKSSPLSDPNWKRVYAAITGLAENSPSPMVRKEALRAKQSLDPT
jgi:hypothetical protein